jgi:hypothetical protein
LADVPVFREATTAPARDQAGGLVIGKDACTCSQVYGRNKAWNQLVTRWCNVFHSRNSMVGRKIICHRCKATAEAQ